MGAAVTPSPGDIGLVSIRGPIGFLVRVGQALNGDGFSRYEHCFVYLGGGELVEAEPGGARVRPLAQYDAAGIVWLRCPPQHGDAVAAAARALEGTPYSWLDYIALALHRLHIPAPGLRAYIQDSGHAICSQLVDEGARRGGWQLFDDRRWEGYVTPGALRKLAANQKGQP
jgi:cell wall-associated NlpC family hydrolase